MIDARTAPFGVALLRVTMGAWFLIHIAFRFLVFGWPKTVAWFQSVGIPEALGAFVTFVETVGGIALVLGFATRISALALLVIMLGTIVSYHGANGFLFTNPKGGWEYPALWAVALVAQALIGPGHFAIDTVLQGYRRKVSPPKKMDRFKA